MSTLVIKIIQVILRLSKLSSEKFIGAVTSILKKMGGNASFPTPDPTLVAVKAKLDAFAAIVATAKNGSNAAKAQVPEARREVMLLLKPLRSYVEVTANANPGTAESVALSSGMYVRKIHAIPPHIFKVKYGPLSGIVIISCPREKKDVTFDFEYTDTPGDESTYISIGATTKAKRTISGLTAGKTYSFRFSKLNTETGQSDWSDPISIIVI